ncbi:hypothetical protein F5884DRAFT_683019 [Xylogone sp. PMI_703]|nr:hypothetical protein F5884DRAFT_683019 [Xylogone sp. PMI_703]
MPSRRIKQFKYYNKKSTVLTIIILCFAIWGVVDLLNRLFTRLSTILESQRYGARKAACWCGGTDAEAISMGCRYDHLAVDWLPNHCIDDELLFEFDHAGTGINGSWPYWTSQYSGELIDLDEINSYAETATDYWTTREWHIQHCIFTWRKQFRAQKLGTTIEPWNMNEEHITHCGKYLLKTVGDSRSDVDTLIGGRNRHQHLME